MDSFFGLFGPSEEQGKSTSKGRHKPGEHAPDSLRNKPDFAAPEVDDSEESSFLCQPQQAGGVMLGGSYIEHHLELNVGEPREVDRRPTRWSSGRKSRRKKNKSSPPKELLHWPGDEPCQPPAEPRPLNNHRPSARTNKSQANVGKNVNNLHQGGGGDADHSRRAQPFEPAAYCGHGSGSDEVHSVIDKLEKVSLKDDVYTRGEFNTEDLGDDPYCSDPYEDSNSEAEDAGTGDETYGSLPPEPRYGNVEYKLQLVCPCERRFQHLITQLKWRLRSGGGAAIYLVGVRDCGALRGLRPRALRSSLRTLRRMAAALNAHLAHVTARRVAPHRAVAEVYIRKLEQQQSVELRVAVMGANEAGKSTLIGVLTQGELDNGTGSARLNMFRHVHEVRSGRTSSLSHEILGFDAQGNVVNYGCSELMTAERIGERSAKLVSFLDLAGHSKYQRTTVHGLTGYSPHHALLVVSATAGITKITEEHLDLLLALDLPFSIVISKCELEPYGALLRELADILRGSNSNKKPLLITDENMARNCVGPQKLILDTVDLGAEPAEPSQDCTDESEMEQVPVFPVSCVKGIGLNALHAYLLAVAPPIVDIQPQPEEEACEFQIDEIFHVGDAGPVVGGLLARGRLYEGDNLLIGPLDTGEFVEIAVITIYRNRVPCDMVRAGQSASLGLSHYPPSLRQGMVLLAVPEAYDRHPPQRRTFGGCSGQCRAAPADTKQRRTKNHRRRDNLLRDIQLAKDNLLKLPTGVDGNIYKQEDTEKVDNHMYQPKDIDNVDTFKQADKENRNIVDYAETEKMDCDIVKQTETELDNNDFNREDIDVNKNTTKEDCTCGDLVYLDDPNDPRGCLYFQATVRLLRHSTGDIHPGFQCTVHVGNVRQTAIIEGILSASGTLSVGARASVVFRFARCPEYVRARRRLLLRAGRETTAVGRLVQVFPHIPSA